MMLQRLLSLFGRGKKEPRKEVKKDKAIQVEEFSFGSQKVKQERRERVAKVKETDELDEIRLFMEVVNNLREYASLPPVEDKKERREEVVLERKKEAGGEKGGEKKEDEKQQETTGEKEASGREEKREEEKEKKEEQKEKTKEVPKKRPLSKAEIEKMVKVAYSHLERELMKRVEEKMREEGRISFKELAMSRRKVRSYMKEHAEVIVDFFMHEIKDGRDPRREDYISKVADDIFPEIFGSVMVENKEERKEGAKKKKEDDLLSLLEEEGEEKKEEDVMDILKSLEE